LHFWAFLSAYFSGARRAAGETAAAAGTEARPPDRERLMKMIEGFWEDEDGVETVEYAVLLILLVVAALATWTIFGAIVRGNVATHSNAINAAN
jgi:Flp pilus assembly pilin Flp